ncbi:hypothetical protein BDZ91DRAFT_800015 [Kalaharituber pfeilii]|nr:hypothetical protein BDZ91DRAFT_800015 [Kalaharituber pfeilii]
MAEDVEVRGGGRRGVKEEGISPHPARPIQLAFLPLPEPSATKGRHQEEMAAFSKTRSNKSRDPECSGKFPTRETPVTSARISPNDFHSYIPPLSEEDSGALDMILPSSPAGLVIGLPPIDPFASSYKGKEKATELFEVSQQGLRATGPRNKSLQKAFSVFCPEGNLAANQTIVPKPSSQYRTLQPVLEGEGPLMRGRLAITEPSRSDRLRVPLQELPVYDIALGRAPPTRGPVRVPLHQASSIGACPQEPSPFRMAPAQSTGIRIPLADKTPARTYVPTRIPSTPPFQRITTHGTIARVSCASAQSSRRTSSIPTSPDVSRRSPSGTAAFRSATPSSSGSRRSSAKLSPEILDKQVRQMEERAARGRSLRDIIPAIPTPDAKEMQVPNAWKITELQAWLVREMQQVDLSKSLEG